MNSKTKFRSLHAWLGASCLALLFSGCNNVTPEVSPQPTDDSPATASGIGDGTEGIDPNASTAAGPGNLSGDGINPPESTSTDSVAAAAPPFGAGLGGANPADNTPPPDANLMNRPFVTIQPSESDDPAVLVSHLGQIDDAIRDLVTAGQSNILQKEAFISYGMRLGKMKLQSGQNLATIESATADQKKAGLVSQLEALSHMSGIGDTESAKALETLAGELQQSDDPDVAHQSRVVLMGFRLQDLQNGVDKDPSQLLAQLEGLFQRPEDRMFPEFMTLQQAHYVLTQMGFKEAAKSASDLLVREYKDSPDPQLRGEAWMFAVQDSQALQNYSLASQSLGTPGFDGQALLAAARGLYEAFPMPATLEQLASTVATIEYSGNVAISHQIAEYIEQQAAQSTASEGLNLAKVALAEHNARLALIGQPLALEGLVGFDGQPFNWQDYSGKVVLLDFWATWCVPCLREIPNIEAVYKELHSEGLEVVAVNMDENPEVAREFISKKDYPWSGFYFQDQTGFNSKFAQSAGLKMIPFIVLVDREGRVAQLHVRGANIAPAVKTLLGVEESLVP